MTTGSGTGGNDEALLKPRTLTEDGYPRCKDMIIVGWVDVRCDARESHEPHTMHHATRHDGLYVAWSRTDQRVPVAASKHHDQELSDA